MAALTSSVKLEMKLEGNRKIVYLTYANGATGAGDTLAAGLFGSITSIDAVIHGDSTATGGFVTTVAFPATSLVLTTTAATGTLLIIGE
jgi:hypothetical protein